MRYFSASALTLAALSLAAGHSAYASTIATVLLGSDYLTTTSATFQGVAFMGVPIGPGNTDTIVQRTQDAVFSSLGTTQTVAGVLSALTLESTAPVNLGAGLGFYFITLQSVHGGPASTGQVSITLSALDDGTAANPEGTFTSFFDVFFDIRFGSVNGPIVASSDLVLTNSGASWDATPSAADVLVTGAVGSQSANLHTGKTLGQLDFFPLGPFTESHPTGATHTVTGATTPEPGAASLLTVGILVFGALWKRRRA